MASAVVDPVEHLTCTGSRRPGVADHLARRSTPRRPAHGGSPGRASASAQGSSSPGRSGRPRRRRPPRGRARPGGGAGDDGARPATRPAPRRTAGNRGRSPCSPRAPAPAGRAASMSRRSRAAAAGRPCASGSPSRRRRSLRRRPAPSSTKSRHESNCEPRSALATPPFIRPHSLASRRPAAARAERRRRRAGALPHSRIRDLLSDRPGPLLGADAEAARSGSRSSSSRATSSTPPPTRASACCWPRSPWSASSRRSAIHRTEDERLRKWFTARRRRLRPRDPRRLQVLRLLRPRTSRDVLDTVGLGMPLPLVDDRAAGRGQLLQLPGGHLRGGRQAPPDRARLACSTPRST